MALVDYTIGVVGVDSANGKLLKSLSSDLHKLVFTTPFRRRVEPVIMNRLAELALPAAKAKPQAQSSVKDSEAHSEVLGFCGAEKQDALSRAYCCLASIDFPEHHNKVRHGGATFISNDLRNPVDKRRPGKPAKSCGRV